MPRPSNTEERRHDIARATLFAIANFGVDGASIQRIAEAAEISPGIVHYHYRDKREILLAVIELIARRAAARIRARIDKAGSARERVHAFTDALLSTGRDEDPESVAAWVALVAESLRDTKIKRAIREVVQNWQDHLASLCREVAPKGAERVAAALMSFVLGCFLHSAVDSVLVPTGSSAPAARAFADKLLPEAAP